MSHVHNIREMFKSWIQWWNRNANFNPILQSRLVLYVLFFFSVLTLFGFALNKEYVFAIIFIIVGFLTSFFSKNMIVILFLSLAITNIIIQGLRGQLGSRKEGLANHEENQEEEDEEEEEKEEEENTGEQESMVSKTKESMKSQQKKQESMETLLESDKKKSKKSRSSSEEEAKRDIKNLLDLQLKLMTGVNSIQPIMKEVEGAINDLRNKSFQ